MIFTTSVLLAITPVVSDGGTSCSIQSLAPKQPGNVGSVAWLRKERKYNKEGLLEEERAQLSRPVYVDHNSNDHVNSWVTTAIVKRS